MPVKNMDNKTNTTMARINRKSGVSTQAYKTTAPQPMTSPGPKEGPSGVPSGTPEPWKKLPSSPWYLSFFLKEGMLSPKRIDVRDLPYRFQIVDDFVALIQRVKTKTKKRPLDNMVEPIKIADGL